MPAGCTRRHVYTLQIMILVTGAALHRRRTHAFSATADIHDVPVQVVSLPWIVASSMADDATRVPQYGQHGFECRDSPGAIRIGISRGNLRGRAWRNEISSQ